VSGLSEQQLAEIRAREAAATEGPWEPCPGWGPTFYGNLRGEYLRGVGDINFGVGEQADADLAFVLAAREDIPALLAEAERQAKRVGHLSTVFESARTRADNLAARVAELERSTDPAAAPLPGEACSCMPHRKFPCGHCEMDLCQDCGDCCTCACGQAVAVAPTSEATR
jgi:hypothetical protein